jgi:hypothetical protein
MNAKAKGTRNEHRSIRLLEAARYACTRAAASLGAWDIIGIDSNRYSRDRHTPRRLRQLAILSLPAIDITEIVPR